MPIAGIGKEDIGHNGNRRLIDWQSVRTKTRIAGVLLDKRHKVLAAYYLNEIEPSPKDRLLLDGPKHELQWSADDHKLGDKHIGAFEALRFQQDHEPSISEFFGIAEKKNLEISTELRTLLKKIAEKRSKDTENLPRQDPPQVR